MWNSLTSLLNYCPGIVNDVSGCTSNNTLCKSRRFKKNIFSLKLLPKTIPTISVLQICSPPWTCFLHTSNVNGWRSFATLSRRRMGLGMWLERLLDNHCLCSIVIRVFCVVMLLTSAFPRKIYHIWTLCDSSYKYI